MTESQTFECANCNDRDLITGKEHVIHKGEGELTERNFRMAFKVVVNEFHCAVCGAEFSNGRWTRRTKDGYEEVENGKWTVTKACEERAKREREAREKVRKAAESIKKPAAKKVDGVRRIEHIMIELEQAREFSPLDEAQLHAWQTISHQPGAVQELLDASPTYQAMLAARGVR